MQKYGLIGYPLKHSFSIGYFNEKFESENIDAQYVNFEIPDIRDFMEVIEENPNLCGLNVTAIFTPGHTSGSVCYLVSGENAGDRVLFTGDTLFAGSVGRTDFPTGDGAALRESLRKLSALPGDMRVLPGHEDETTLETELRENPWMCG